jgi:deazaflavin-dependent oxidoreductase (nitroreductase family)
VRDGTAKVLSTLHRAIFRVSGGRIGKRLVDNDMLLLTTRGRRSGRPHTVPLLYLRNGSGLVVVASWGGRPYHPDWYLNLVDDPQATVELPGERFTARARTAGEEERARLWPAVVTAWDGYATYQSRTDRQIPLVMLERV